MAVIRKSCRALIRLGIITLWISLRGSYLVTLIPLLLTLSYAHFPHNKFNANFRESFSCSADDARVSRDTIFIFSALISLSLLHNDACRFSHLPFCFISSSLLIFSWFCGYLDKELVLSSTCFFNTVRLYFMSFSSANEEFSDPESMRGDFRQY